MSSGNPALHVSVACSVLLLLLCIYTVFSPSSLSLDPDAVPGTDAAPDPEDTVDNPALAVEQPGKPPLSIPISPILFSHACIRIATATATALPILMHSLFIVTCC
jgi:hypothetical protein